MALLPRITKLDNSILPNMYKEGWVLVAIYNDCMYFHRNEQVVVDEEHLEKQAMFENMAELKRDPLAYKKLEEEAFLQLSKKQQDSEAMRFHRDTKLRQMIMQMIQE